MELLPIINYVYLETSNPTLGKSLYGHEFFTNVVSLTSDPSSYSHFMMVMTFHCKEPTYKFQFEKHIFSKFVLYAFCKETALTFDSQNSFFFQMSVVVLVYDPSTSEIEAGRF